MLVSVRKETVCILILTFLSWICLRTLIFKSIRVSFLFILSHILHSLTLWNFPSLITLSIIINFIHSYMGKFISTNDLNLYNFKHMNYILFQSRACSWPQIYPTARNTIFILKFFNCTNLKFQIFNSSSSPFKFSLSPEFPLSMKGVTIHSPSNMKSVLLFNFFLALLLFNQQWHFIEY